MKKKIDSDYNFDVVVLFFFEENIFGIISVRELYKKKNSGS